MVGRVVELENHIGYIHPELGVVFSSHESASEVWVSGSTVWILWKDCLLFTLIEKANPSSTFLTSPSGETDTVLSDQKTTRFPPAWIRKS